MRLSELLSVAQPLQIQGSQAIDIKGLRHDSRDVQSGDAFFALGGSRTDGNRYVKAACDRGAAAIISELEPPPPPASLRATWIQVGDAAKAMSAIAARFFGYPSQSMAVIGVTGTNGKTTTTYLLESIFAAGGGICGVIGTVDYRLRGKQICKAPNTTPISLELQRLLAHFRDEAATHVAMEVSSHALALGRVEDVDFDAAIFTNLTRDHLDFHKTPQDYQKAKARLFELLGKASNSKKKRLAVINAEDPKADAMRRASYGAETIFFGLSEKADLRAVELETTLAGTDFTIQWKGKSIKAGISLVGEHNVYNALGAAAAALGLGVSQQNTISGLKALGHIPGRLEPVNEGQPFHVFVDYAHTDAALSTVLGYLNRLPHGRLITVFGCGGDRDRGKRGPMGVAACSASDHVIVTSDNPRSEDPKVIVADIEAGLKTAGCKNYKILLDRAAAIEQAVRAAQPGDIVLIAGKGHEDYQILSDRTIHFDDRQAARAALRGGRP